MVIRLRVGQPWNPGEGGGGFDFVQVIEVIIFSSVQTGGGIVQFLVRWVRGQGVKESGRDVILHRRTSGYSTAGCFILVFGILPPACYICWPTGRNTSSVLSCGSKWLLRHRRWDSVSRNVGQQI
jgi:hypothetical protein